MRFIMNASACDKVEASKFGRYGSEAEAARTTEKFLTLLWAVHQRGYVFLAARSAKSGRWIERSLSVPIEPAKVRKFLTRYPRAEYDLYFCPNAFKRAKRATVYAKTTPLAWCDIDDAQVAAFQPQPNLAWRTSPGRHQAIWLWDRQEEPRDAQAFSRSLAYRFGGDRNGWSITKMLRIPGSINHKPQYRRPFVKLIGCLKFGSQKERPKRLSLNFSMNPISFRLLPDWECLDRYAVFERYRLKLHAKPRTLLRHKSVQETDRSKCIYEIIAGLHDVGATSEEIACMVWRSPYFVSKHGPDKFRLETEITRVLGKLVARK